MTDREDPAPPDAESGSRAEEAFCGSGEVRKGADVLFVPPVEPVTEPSPMPVNMAPEPPSSSAGPPAEPSGDD